MATGPEAGEVPEVEIEFPRTRKDGATARTSARLADACEGKDPAPDLVLLLPDEMPSGVMTLQLAAAERFEVGSGFAYARLARTDPNGRDVWKYAFPKGEIDRNTTNSGLRQFTGELPQSY
jgi:hypothetical protein